MEINAGKFVSIKFVWDSAFIWLQIIPLYGFTIKKKLDWIDTANQS